MADADLLPPSGEWPEHEEVECATEAVHTFEVRTVLRIRLVDMYGDPLPGIDVKLHKGSAKTPKQADGDAHVVHADLTGSHKVKTPDGKRVIFANWEFMRPERYDPDDSGAGFHVDSHHHQKNDSFEPDQDGWIAVKDTGEDAAPPAGDDAEAGDDPAAGAES